MYSKRPDNEMLLEGGRNYKELSECIDEHLYHRSFNDEAHPIFYWTESLETYLNYNKVCEIY